MGSASPTDILLSQMTLREKVSQLSASEHWRKPAVPRLSINALRVSDRCPNAFDKSIRMGDLIYLLQGASKPLIIRLCQDHCAVIMITATPPEEIETESGSVRASGLFQSITIFSRNFLLVWDWERSAWGLQDRKNTKH
jgi:hypothetical protein